MKRIVIVSSGQPSANPRAVKEAVLLSRHGFKVSFIYCPISPWADEFDGELFAKNPAVTWIKAGAHPAHDKWHFRLARLRKKIFSKIAGLIPKNPLIALRSSALFSHELEYLAQKHPADLYIGHNLGSIRAVMLAAKKHGAKVGFDAEDFHRGENKPEAENYKTAVIENRYMPEMDYLTAASPLTSKAYSHIFPKSEFVTINNVFSREYLQEIPVKTAPGLKLFWFSQFTGPERGIENVIEAMNICKNKDIHLYLLGNVKQEYKFFLINKSDNKNIHFIGPVANQKIFEIAAAFDIGLASELSNSLNHEYCLANKIFTYLLAGNCILFSDTQGHRDFLHDNPGTGILYPQNAPEQLAVILNRLYTDMALLSQFKRVALDAASTRLNLEIEGEIFLRLVNKTLSK